MFFKGINELAEGLGFASLLSRTKKKAAADEAKEKFKVLIKFILRFKIPAYARMTDWLEEMTMP
ncbi:hypothetical protein ASE92_15855 [Pedobacter sp. Leaf41]|uniref:hypothetical protein n=1 Tax=Pedobacter sp. Leaf41 TaxID=1736218 RepID=UPI00070330F1|nr:hypothetical protein [Pedobacter sp. Leaf41]KQN34098.1 hypothetical protein ASE92_15855 [Pedobacter sp. Leaf41]RZJ66602.1 MAG: hypothetical protein EOO45_15990 [Flavobacterium sp.]